MFSFARPYFLCHFLGMQLIRNWKSFQAMLKTWVHKKYSKPVLFGVLFFVLHASWVILNATSNQTVISRWNNLYRWDSEWYGSIVTNGYISENPPKKWDVKHSNVAYFPGYPISASLLRDVTGLQTIDATILTAWIFTFAFWIMLFVGLQLAKPNSNALDYSLLGLVWIAFPTSFYMYAAYSESLFLCGLVLTWIGLFKKNHWILFLGVFVASSTRVVGISYVAGSLFCLLVGWLMKDVKGTFNWKIALASLLGLSGVFAFFIFCQSRFDDWALYFTTQSIGWENQANLAALIKEPSWIPKMSDIKTIFYPLDAIALSRLSVPFFSWVSLLGGCFCLWRVLKQKKDAVILSTIWFVGCAPFLGGVVGVYNSAFLGMIRYVLPAYLGLAIAFVFYRQSFRPWVYVLLSPVLIWSMYLGVLAIRTFTAWRWVA